MKVESKAQLNSLRMSSQKVRLVADVIRGLPVDEARVQLQFSRKAAAKPLYTLLNSAIANAVHNHKLDPKTLVVSTIYVNDGAVLKRWMPRAMGRATPLRKRSSHITVVLSGESHESGAERKVGTEAETVTEVKDTIAPASKTKKKSTVSKVSKPRARSRATAS